MTDEGLLAAILAEPDNDEPRLVYADWLDDHGDHARAAFIRLECALHGMLTPAGGAPEVWEQPRFRALRSRATELWSAHAERWYPGLERYAKEVETERGFPHHVALPVRQFLSHGEAIFAVAPTVRNVFLGRLGRNTPALAACPALAHVRELTFFETPFRAREAEQFFASPHLGNLRSFEIGFTDTQMGPRGARALAGCRSLGPLEHLDVHNHAVYDSGARSLLVCQRLTALRRLHLGNNGLTDSAAHTLSEVRHLNRLTNLNLSSNHLTSRGAEHLSRSESLAGLEQLVLSQNPIGPAGVWAILGAPFAARLTRLRIGACRLNDPDLASLLGSERLPNLAELSLWDRVGERSTRALGGNEGFAKLRSFDLASCGLTPAAAGLLGGVRTLPALRRLNLRNNPLRSEGLRRFLAGPLVRTLDWLDLDRCELGDEGAAVLAAADPLPALRVLWLADNRIGDAGARVLAASPALAAVRSLHLRGNAIGDAAKAVLRDRFGDEVSF